MRRQDVKLYFDVTEATRDMRKRIEQGWFIHTCTMSSHDAGYKRAVRILVVYEMEV